jgi:hypothetical protein
MDAVAAFIANGEATKPVEPGERALDDPAELKTHGPCARLIRQILAPVRSALRLDAVFAIR